MFYVPMFYVICVAVCLAVLFIVMTGAGLVCTACLSLLRPLLRQTAPRISANLLFTLRALPLLLAFLVTFGFVLPAFLKFEPRSTSELMGGPLLGLAVLGASVLVAIGIRGARLIAATRRAQRQWRLAATRLHVAGIDIPVYQVNSPATLLAVSGVFRPKIFIGRQVAATLTSAELSAALIHEIAHVASLDNLKQFLLRITRLFPRTDIEWTNASEIAADEAALASGASVLDLSLALIKVGRLGQGASRHDAIVASHLLPASPGSSGSSMEMRVTHLQKLLEGHCQPRGDAGHKYCGLLSFLLLFLSYATCVNAVLPWIHEALEFLVR
jgi:Zn-dependent protease with chaperone function